MKNDRTNLIFILDESGSMGHLRDAVISGFNEVLQEQQKGEGQVLVNAWTFN